MSVMTSHYISYVSLHVIACHYTPMLFNTVGYMSLNSAFIAFRYTSLHFQYISLRVTRLHYSSVHFITCQYI